MHFAPRRQLTRMHLGCANSSSSSQTVVQFHENPGTSVMHSRNYEISWRRAETRKLQQETRTGNLRSSRRNSLCPREWHKKSWEWPTWQIIVSRIRATLPLLSRQTAKWGRYIRRMVALAADRHFPSEAPSRWYIGGLSVLAVMLTPGLYGRRPVWCAIFFAKQ